MWDKQIEPKTPEEFKKLFEEVFEMLNTRPIHLTVMGRSQYENYLNFVMKVNGEV